MISICTLAPGARILVTRGTQTTEFFAGVAVDLDAIAVEAHDGRPADTWADLLGVHVAHFSLDAAPADEAFFADDARAGFEAAFDADDTPSIF